MAKTKKIFTAVSVLVVLTALLSLFSYSVFYVAKGGKKLGALSGPIEAFASFPKTAMAVLKSPELNGIPPTYTKNDPAFREVNNLEYDVYGLNSFYNIEKDLWEIKLFNFKDDSILYQWDLKEEYYQKGERQFKNSEPRNAIILPDYSLIVGNDESKNLYKLDKYSKVVWHNTSKLFHHSLNLDHENNIWAGTRSNRGIRDSKNTTRYYRDDYITKISAETGEVLFDKSVSDILIDNGYKNFVYGASNHIGYSDSDRDPLHLNDIEPALEDGPFWKKGDVFVSLRNKSIIFLYRPETNKVIHMLYGPFLNQHDVDIISDKEVSIFNNNLAEVGTEEGEAIVKELGQPQELDETLSSSDIVIYNFEDSVYRTHLKHHFDKEKIFTRTQGFHEHLSTGDVYVESQNNGKMYIVNDEEVVLKKLFHTSVDNMVERPHWIRIYEDLNF